MCLWCDDQLYCSPLLTLLLGDVQVCFEMSPWLSNVVSLSSVWRYPTFQSSLEPILEFHTVRTLVQSVAGTLSNHSHSIQYNVSRKLLTADLLVSRQCQTHCQSSDSQNRMVRMLKHGDSLVTRFWRSYYKKKICLTLPAKKIKQKVWLMYLPWHRRCYDSKGLAIL